MALKTNFTDDILAESMNGKRQYNVTENSNGTKSLEDVTDYQSVGSTFSAKDMNETNAAVNQAYDDIGDEFNPEVDYAVGDYTIRNNKVWKFTTAHPAGAWDKSHVKATKILSEARELTEKIEGANLTQERLIGKINGENVYEKILASRVDISKTASFAVTKISHGIANMKYTVSIECLGGAYILPYFDTVGALLTYIQSVDKTNINIYSKSPWPNYTFRFVIRYTKNE